jgi:hypothetical protein
MRRNGRVERREMKASTATEGHRAASAASDRNAGVNASAASSMTAPAATAASPVRSKPAQARQRNRRERRLVALQKITHFQVPGTKGGTWSLASAYS